MVDMPSFLFLGKQEAALLREDLAQAFGQEAVSKWLKRCRVLADHVELSMFR